MKPEFDPEEITVECPECGNMVTQEELNAFHGTCEECYHELTHDEYT